MSRSWRSWLCEEVEAAMLSVPEVCSDPPCQGTPCRHPHYGDFQGMAAAAVAATFKWLARDAAPSSVGRAHQAAADGDPLGVNGPKENAR